MTYPRCHLIDTENGGFYHLISRCVRRAWLCGDDALTGRNFDHRRKWIEERILQLGEVFSVAIYGYAVMSNHYHIAVKSDPKATSSWSDRKVAERWLQLCPPKRKGVIDEEARRLQVEALTQQPDRLRVLRERLGSLSWLMRFINEPLARLANQEDQCKGRFWEGRFNSQALLDESSLLACTAYVDLNPIRAGISDKLESSEFTSIKRRMEKASGDIPPADKLFGPLVTGVPEAGNDLDLTLADYITLVEWTVWSQSDKRKTIKPHLINGILTGMAQDEASWLEDYAAQRNRYQRAFGSIKRLKAYAKKIGQKWIQCRRKQPAALLSN